jgi:hypothetical protein
MNGFFELFARNAARPKAWEDSDWADERFPEVVAESPFHLWQPGDPVPRQGLRLLIGVATWSGYDMRLLDVVAEAAADGRGETIEVFNTAECKDPRDFARYIPSRAKVLHTPVVGEWREGVLAWSGSGESAQEHVTRLFGTDSDAIVAHVQEWIQSHGLSQPG